MRLTDDHISYIIKDLNYRGIVAENVQAELIDHLCAAVESEMEQGKRFIDAYHKTLRSFGHNSGLRETQKQILQVENKTFRLMLKNYLTVAVRNLRKQSFYSLINILGLAIGIASCMIIVLFVFDELAYDRYNSKANRIYRVDAEIKFAGNNFKMTYRSAPEAQALLQDYPEIESAVRFRHNGSYLVRPADGNENIKQENVIWADSTFFKIFSVKVLEGNSNNALSQPASVAISKKMADKYFPEGSALGKTIILDNKYNATVTAVYEDIPSTSHFHFDIIIAMIGDWPIAQEASSTSFMSENFNTYLLLKEGADAKSLESKLPGFIDKHMGPEVKQAFGAEFSMEKFRASGNKYDLTLRPLTDIHLHSDIKGELEPNGSITYVFLLSIVAVFILAIGCINFMNLSTARSSNRAKEVGVRKVMGSLRSHLIRQFLMESTLLTLLSFVIAVFFAYLSLPVFNSLSQKQLYLPFQNPVFYLILAGACVLIGLMAGLYPSFFLSAFKPVSVLKGRVALGMKSGFIRSSLVVFQFVISIFLIVGAISINQQISYIQNKKLGFEKDQVIIVHDAYALRPNNVQSFKDEVLKFSSIESGTISGYVPVENDWSWRSNNSIWKEGTQPSTENLTSTQIWGVDYDYIKTFRMQIRNGRDFSAEFPSDSSAIIINQTLAKRLGLSEDAIGTKLNTFDGAPNPEHPPLRWTVIGIVDDFHFSTMKQSITPLALFLSKNDGSACFRFRPDKTSEVITSIESVWKKLAPGQPFQYSFLDEDFSKMYHTEQRLAKIFSLFAGLAIIIACLGLFALTAFTAEQKTKEIGIRKVLGASVKSIVFLLSQEFGKLVIIAFVLAAPLAWFAVRWWLEDYTYKVEIGWTIYTLAGIIALVIAFATMSFQSIKAATANPVNSLRSE